MNKTKIPWVKNPDGTPGWTVNPLTGCLNCIDGKCGGIFPCYAFLESMGRCHQQDLKGIPVGRFSYDSFYPRIHESRFDQLDKAPKGAGIFICDRSDWAASYWPQWCQDRILNAARARPDIRLYLLTKQPQELAKFCPFPENCWVGVSATNDKQYIAGLKGLGEIQATVKFISFEPLLEEIINNDRDHGFCNLLSYYHISWLIIGNQNHPVKYPKPEWVEEIITAADQAGIPVFVKSPLAEYMGIQRQEFPKGVERQ